MIADTITSFSCKRGLPEEKMAIGNIGTGSISTLAKLNTGRDHLQVARLAGIDGVEVEVTHAARQYWNVKTKEEYDGEC